jgi:glutathionylspermidine synthase
MERIALTPRPGWQEKVEALGFHYHTIDAAPYWDESVAYRFTSAQIHTLETVSQELYDMALQAAQHVIDKDLFSRLQIPVAFEELIVRSWEADDLSLYGRFDLVYDGKHPPRLLEFNADTPTALLEASVIQWFWLQDVFPQADQFNSIHEKLIAGWSEGAKRLGGLVHFAATCASREDCGNLDYLRDTAMQAGIETCALDIGEIGWDEARRCFVDLEERPIRSLFKLYPWEWLTREEFGGHLAHADCRYLEPPWKMLLSNKGILAVMWELFPGHPNLLPTYFEAQQIKGDRVRKPLYSREGANVTIVRNGQETTTPGTYGAEGFIWQAYSPLPAFSGKFPVIGSWIVNHQACGIGIREDDNEITTDTSRFVPHFFTE